ncbi:MAG: glycerol kinase GlpK [Verrucomicrobia bacterium]|nr:glycerol kinase GlpK [Verrucomicrobiota bacterium]MCH8512394.1 glycerol kinase GlpK [Kiritimatiellia bacterium]
MPETYMLAIDQGTTSSRAIVFDHRGRTVASAQKEFPQHYPKPGWVEHDPMDIWSSQSTVTAEAVSKANLDSDRIAAVGITNQRETVIVWDKKSGKPIYNAIVWQDRRTARTCKRLQKQLDEAGKSDLIRQKTGLTLDPYFSATKIAWILDNVDGARQRAEAGELLCGTVDTWLIWKFTGGKVHVTDVTNACRTLLFNLKDECWDDELLSLFDVPHQMLPEVKSCSEVYGHISANLYPGGVPIAGIAGDQHAALFGQACFEPGMAKNTYGTGCFLLMQTGTESIRSENNLLSTIAWKIGDTTEYALEGSVFIGGAVIQWLRDELRIIQTASECDHLAETVSDSGGLYLVPAFAGLGAPHWDPLARGACFGITRGTNRAHFCRAALESIAFQSYDLMKCMEKDSGITLKELRVDGGASKSRPLMQFQSDLLQRDVVQPQCIETTALGAAYLAGLAVGFWKSREEILENWEEGKRYKPGQEGDDMRAGLAKWQRAVKRSKDWLDEDES